MIELTSEMIIEIRGIILQRYGGLPGILCQGTIDYLITRINDEPDHFKKAAFALHLIALHPFNDGQKRTGFQVADNILRTSGLRISASKEVICRVLCEIAEYNCTLFRIEQWQNALPLPRSPPTECARPRMSAHTPVGARPARVLAMEPSAKPDQSAQRTAKAL